MTRVTTVNSRYIYKYVDTHTLYLAHPHPHRCTVLIRQGVATEVLFRTLPNPTFLSHACKHTHSTDLQCTTMGLFPVCCCVRTTWSIKSIIPSPDEGAPFSGQAMKWNCFTTREVLLVDCMSGRGK